MKQEHAQVWHISHVPILTGPATVVALPFLTIRPFPDCKIRDLFPFSKLPQAQTLWLLCSQLWEAASLQVTSLPSLPAGLMSNESVTEDGITGTDFNIYMSNKGANSSLAVSGFLLSQRDIHFRLGSFVLGLLEVHQFLRAGDSKTLK